MVLPTAAGKPCYGRDGISCRPSRQLFRERLAEIHFHEMYRKRHDHQGCVKRVMQHSRIQFICHVTE